MWDGEKKIFNFYMIRKLFVSCFLFVLLGMTSSDVALASFVIQSQDTVDVKLKGYHGLTGTLLFKGRLTSGTKQTIETPCRGLCLLIFEKGQQYPVVFGGQSFTLHIVNPDNPPSFTKSGENEFFYKYLTGAESGPGQYDFVRLMIQAKELLDSSYSIHTVAELNAMKEKFHTFVRAHYLNLQYSDMLMRLIGQYFMMHEYVDFHIEGAPASDIQVQYKKAVVNGVGNWIGILKGHIPEHDVLNYCVSLYYNRSMVSLSSLIVDSFRDVAYCPGNRKKSISFQRDVSISNADGNRKGTLRNIGNDIVIAFVSDECPISMVKTVIEARRLAAQKEDKHLVVVPLEQLSDKHLAMRRMITTENMYFVNDEEWRKQNLPKGICLPLFGKIAPSNI